MSAMGLLLPLTSISGAVTVTVKEHVAELPEPSVTRCVTVVVPTGNAAPLARPAMRVVVAPVQLSVPDGVVYVTVAVQGAAFCEMLLGQVIDGKVLSTLFTVKLQVFVLPCRAVFCAKSVTENDPVPETVDPIVGEDCTTVIGPHVPPTGVPKLV